jgi:hypothetical protein
VDGQANCTRLGQGRTTAADADTDPALETIGRGSLTQRELDSQGRLDGRGVRLNTAKNSSARASTSWPPATTTARRTMPRTSFSKAVRRPRTRLASRSLPSIVPHLSRERPRDVKK